MPDRDDVIRALLHRGRKEKLTHREWIRRRDAAQAEERPPKRFKRLSRVGQALPRVAGKARPPASPRSFTGSVASL
jgi:hypothetical protein